jgi:hypothetical protein
MRSGSRQEEHGNRRQTNESVTGVTNFVVKHAFRPIFTQIASVPPSDGAL